MSCSSLPHVAAAEFAAIRATSGPIPPRLGELWRYRELFYFLVRRDVRVRYAQTLLGGVWVVFQPLAMMLVFLFAFRKLARIETGEVAYPVFALSGLALWVFVSRSVIQGANSLVTNIDLLTKTACPRLLTPIAAIVAAFVDFLVAFALVLVLAAGYGAYPSWRFAFVPLLLLLALVFVLGLSLLLSALNVRYRDIRQSLPFLVQLWLFLSPVAYPLRLSEPWSTVIAVNPLVGTIEAFRWAVLATPFPAAETLGIAVAVALVALGGGLAHFSRVERRFADDV